MNLLRRIIESFTHNHVTHSVVQNLDKVEERTSNIEKQVCEMRTRTDKLYRFVSAMRGMDRDGDKNGIQ